MFTDDRWYWLTIMSILASSNFLPLLAQDCSNPVYRSVAQTLYERVSFDTTVSCGWWGWRRCRRTRYLSISRVVYRSQLSGTMDTCCAGYQRNGEGNCEPICDGNCGPPHYCQSPGTCVCIELGFTGPNCETPICQDGCPSPRVCTAPDVCQCMHGFTGPNCSTDIDECADNRFCEQICNNHRGSYSCACQDDFFLASDEVQCIGKSNASLTTVNESVLLVALEQPYWDTGGLIHTYNITCFLEAGNTTDLVTTLVDGSDNETVLNLDTGVGYTCCVSVKTNIGDGPTTCSGVQPLLDPTLDSTDYVEAATKSTKKGISENNGTKNEALEFVGSKVFVIVVASGGGLALLLFVIFLTLLCWCICRCRSPKSKITIAACQTPLVDGHDYDNELYSVHPTKYEPVKKIDGDDDELQYNAMYDRGMAVDNDYASVRRT